MPTIKAPLVLNGFQVATVTATDAARIERDRLLTLVRKGNTIKDAAGAQRATDLLIECTAFRDTIEKSRVEAKAPALKIEREINALARELSAEIRNEVERLSRIIGTWNNEQKRLAAEERRAAAAREQKIIDDANREAERKRKEAADAQAEIDRKAAEDARIAKEQADAAQAELDAKAARTRTENGAARVAKEKADAAQKALDDAEAIRVKAEEDRRTLNHKNEAASDKFVAGVENAIVNNRVAAASVVANKTQGVATRTDFEYEVTSLVQLYEANPLLVTLSPNAAAIKNALKMLDEGQHIPGITHWKTFKAGKVARK